MAEVGIKELRDGLSRYVEAIRQGGEPVIITDHGKPVAKLVGLESWDERYASLVAAGAISPPRVARRPDDGWPERASLSGGSVAELVRRQRR